MLIDDKIIKIMLKYRDNCSITNKIINNSKFACKMIINHKYFLYFICK